MVCPRMGEGATPGEFDIFRVLNVNFPTLGSPLRVKSLNPLGITVLE